MEARTAKGLDTETSIIAAIRLYALLDSSSRVEREFSSLEVGAEFDESLIESTVNVFVSGLCVHLVAFETEGER